MTSVDRIYNEHQQLIGFLESNDQFSLIITVDESFRKSLTLSIASYFEVETVDCLLNYFREVGNSRLYNFAKIKGIDMQYHRLFQWDRKNVNGFFALFGEEFKIQMEDKVKNDNSLQEGIRAFLEIGDLRNKLVHRDFASFAIDKTVAEIYELYRKAKTFVDRMPSELRQP